MRRRPHISTCTDTLADGTRFPRNRQLSENLLAAALAASRLSCDDGTDPAFTVSGAWIFISDARGSAAALARDLSEAQQPLAAVNGKPERKDPLS